MTGQPAERSAGAPVLRPYQHDLLSRTYEAIATGRQRIIQAAPTGDGKTVTASEIIRQFVGRGRRVLFLAHRRELIHQAHLKLYDNGIDAGIILAGHPSRLGEPMQIASIRTLSARAIRSRTIDLLRADLVVIDEARCVRIARPPRGCDFNDLLLGRTPGIEEDAT